MVAGLALIVIAVQLFFSAFLLGVLEIPLSRRSADGPELTATGLLGPGLRSHVHGRAGRPCRRCGTAIVQDEVGAAPAARPVFYCPRCQPPAQD